VPTLCGSLEVPENPNHPDIRKLPIAAAVVPATHPKPLSDPIAILMGGSGEDAISAAQVYVAQFTTLRQDRDILLVDQRGTGQSDALNCSLYSAQKPALSLRDVYPPAAAERCEHDLRVGADLTQYTYDRFAEDLEHVRRALGYGPLNLFAGSYGTRAAQVYLRMFPKSVRTVYMGSIDPIDIAQPLPFAKTGQTALEKMFVACAGDSACNAAFPHLREEFRQISSRLSSGSVRVQVAGQPSTAPLDAGRVAEWFRSKLIRPRSATALPWMVHRAFLGDWTPISEGILSEAGNPTPYSFGVFFAITCSEDIPYIQEGDIAAATQGTFLGDYRVRQQQAACKFWPRASLPNNYREPVRSSVPTVFVEGDTDGATPLWYMQHADQGFNHRMEVVLRGHVRPFSHTRMCPPQSGFVQVGILLSSRWRIWKPVCYPSDWSSLAVLS
jgi:pimeloyl-ACP methyl ester carboxylesterase